MTLVSYVIGYGIAFLFLALLSLNVYHALGLWALVFWLACSYGLKDKGTRNMIFYGFLLVSLLLNIIEII